MIDEATLTKYCNQQIFSSKGFVRRQLWFQYDREVKGNSFGRTKPTDYHPNHLDDHHGSLLYNHRKYLIINFCI